jgi:hypothetical protein
MGLKSIGYQKMIEIVPLSMMWERENEFPRIPFSSISCAKREFQRNLNSWRRELHAFDQCETMKDVEPALSAIAENREKVQQIRRLFGNKNIVKMPWVVVHFERENV